MTSRPPIYLIASERSGTNLLRKRFTDCQASYIGPSPAHFLKNLYYREPFYGDLANDDNFATLIRDALDLCYLHFAPWDVAFTPPELIAQYGSRPRNVILLADFMMRRFAESKGYESYFCKDNWLYEFATDIATVLPDAMFVYLYRDPRDFVLSQRKRPGASGDVVEHATLWDYEQTKSIRAARALAKAGRCMSISYEELIADEDRVLADLCRFVGVEKKEKANRSSDNVISTVHEWKNLERETLKDNSRKFEAEFGRGTIARIEVVCARTMALLGYERVTDRRRAIRPLELAARFVWFNAVRMLRRPFQKTARDTVGRSQLLRRLHVNYRNPG